MSDAWIHRYHPAPDASVRLVCFPYAGGSASYYFAVSRALAPDVDVLAIQYPGRQDRRHEKPIDNLHILADRVAEALTPWDDRPMALFGHSMGASVAFEVAQRLNPLALFVSGRSAPSRHESRDVHLRSEDGLVAELRALSATDPALLADAEVLKMILPAVKSDYMAAETYRCAPGARVSAPVTALVGTDDPYASVDSARAWREHTTGQFDLHTFPGGHFYLNAQPERVLDIVRAGLVARVH